MVDSNIAMSSHRRAVAAAEADAGRVTDLDPSGGWESAILVPVPEAEPVVGHLRARLDRAASRGVPAHVTVLYPFVPPSLLSATVITLAAAAVATVPGFDCRFAATGWFDDDVVWLAPEPSAPFRAPTAAVHAAFPQYPPFGGAFPEVIPHLTIGDRPDGGLEALRAAEAQVAPTLPVQTEVRHAWLMTGTWAPDSWHLRAMFPLGT